MKRIVLIILSDIIKSKIVLAFTLILALLSWSSFLLEDNPSKGLLTVLNVILFTVPLFSILFSTIYLYNSAEFIELVLSQPVKRRDIWLSLYYGLCVSTGLAFFFGAGLPLLVYAPVKIGVMMLVVGLLISIIFVALAFFTAVLTRDKAKGIGLAILFWLFFALLFDGILLFLLFQLADYPIEPYMAGATALNPIDLARIQMLLHLDVSAMMGYTGAIFKSYFGSSLGIVVSFVLLLLWSTAPFVASHKKFIKKDL